ncbi:MAG: isoaspartyl peptidase/L-asparaginase [Marinilabiliales bacterium]
MKKLIFYLFILLTFNSFSQNDSIDYAIVIHGGAGYSTPESLTKDQQEAYTAVLNKALNKGKEILESGGTALDVVENVIIILENSPLFNAGKGAVFTHDGKNELDASIMDGATLNAGAVAGVTVIKNPISAARKVMENSKHVLLSGKGAEIFAQEQGLEIVDPSYFFTQENYDYLQKVIENEKQKKEDKKSKHGTVGCVVLDSHGNLAAGTSTGGMTNKMYGRIGDSPIIGAGTYANNNTCAVSCTGHGEYFIRYSVAYDVSALMEYKNMPLKDAAKYIIQTKLKNAGGNGGLIAIDKQGNICMEFNTPSMIRAYLKANGERNISFFKD